MGEQLTEGPPATIAWIGTGAMGAPMVARLRDCGHEVIVLDLRNGVDETARAQLGDVRIAMTCLPAADDVRAVWTGTPGLFELLGAPATLIDLSTIGSAAAVELSDAAKAAGHHAVDAPVSGGPAAAEAGTLSLMVGSDSAAAIDDVREVLGHLGTVRLCGGAGAGQQVKLINQSVLAGLLGGLGMGHALARRSGLDPEVVLEVLQGGVVRGFLLDALWPLMSGEQWHGGFAAKHMVKDLSLARDLAVEAEVPGDLLDVVEQWLRAAMSDLGGDVATQAITVGASQ